MNRRRRVVRAFVLWIELCALDTYPRPPRWRAICRAIRRDLVRGGSFERACEAAGVLLDVPSVVLVTEWAMFAGKP